MLGIKKRRETIRSVFRKIYLGHNVENKWQVKREDGAWRREIKRLLFSCPS